jgi:ubiquitin-conjugating enzyme E2 S
LNPGWFATKIFHPNVGGNGEICVNTLKKDWKSTYGIGHILVTVKCLLIYPNPESALDEEAGKLLLEDYQSYCDRAKLITSVHATPKIKPVEFNKPSSVDTESPTPSSSKDTPSKAVLSCADAVTPVASTSKLPVTSLATLPTSLAAPSSTSSSESTTSLSVPTISRKSASPAPQMSLKTSLTSEKEGLSMGPHKERHPSPSPLGTADANVGKPGMGVGLGMASTAGMGGITGTKAVKRAATGSGATNAEKRKKALKRL